MVAVVLTHQHIFLSVIITFKKKEKQIIKTHLALEYSNTASVGKDQDLVKGEMKELSNSKLYEKWIDPATSFRDCQARTFRVSARG